METTKENLIQFIREHKLSGKILCIHCSLSSFGHLEGGAKTIVDAFLSESCTILVPTHSWAYLFLGNESIPFNSKDKTSFSQRAWDFSCINSGIEECYFHKRSQKIDKDMGALSRYIVQHPERIRSNNPLSSFCAIGPDAALLMENENSFYHPLKRLVELKGYVLLLGVDINKMTLIHFAKQNAGHSMLLRWALSQEGEPKWVAGGGCSNGFTKLKSLLNPVTHHSVIGMADCKLLRADKVMEALENKLISELNYPKCDNEDCQLCQEAGEFCLPDDNNYYIIDYGDTLFKISEKLNIPLEELTSLYKDPNSIQTGSLLKMPPSKVELQ